jgi:stage V sporulation protein B
MTATAPSDDTAGETRKADASVQAGRGGLAIAAAKLYFIVLGFAQQSLVNHLLGAGYGTYRRAQSLATIVYNPVVTSGVQGVSRSVSAAAPEDRPAAARRSVLLQALGVQPLALGFYLGAPSLSRALHAEHLTPAFRILAAVIALYGVYAPLVGVLNGTRRFVAQAALDSLFATLRTVGLALGAYWFGRRGVRFDAVEGSLLGFVAAVALIVVISIPIAGLGAAGSGGVTWQRQLAFLAPLYIGQFTLNLLMQSDLHVLGRLAADAAASAGLDPREADRLVGAYGVAQLFCFLPYQLLLSVTFVLFPLLASAHRDGAREAVASYVRTGVRLALVIAGAFVAVNAGLGSRLLALVFRAEDAVLGGAAMIPLGVGLGGFALFGVLATVLTSLGHERKSAGLTVAALALVLAATTLLARGAALGEAMLLRIALGTACGLLTATGLAAFAVHRAAGAVVGVASFARVVGSTFTACVLGRVLAASLPQGKPLTLAVALVVGLAYLAVLVATRELGRADLDMVSRLARRRRG